MKSLHVFTIAISLLGFIACNQKGTDTPHSCTDLEAHNHLVQKNVGLSYEHSLIIPEEYWFMKGINQSEFVTQLFDATAKGKVIAYAPLSEVPLTKEEITETFVGIPDGQAPCPINEVTGIVFEEEWVLDTAKFIMQKQVLSYTLVREYMRTNREGEQELTKSVVATYNFKNNVPKDLSRLTLLEKNVAYEVPLENELMPEWYQNLPLTHVRNVIMNKLLDSSQIAYSFIFRDSLVQVTIPDLRLRLGEESYYEEEMDEETGEVDSISFEKHIDYSEIIGLAFIEDWYLDTETMQIYKEVKGIGPVRLYSKALEEGNIEQIRTIPFIMYFSNHEKGE